MISVVGMTTHFVERERYRVHIVDNEQIRDQQYKLANFFPYLQLYYRILRAVVVLLIFVKAWMVAIYFAKGMKLILLMDQEIDLGLESKRKLQ